MSDFVNFRQKLLAIQAIPPLGEAATHRETQGRDALATVAAAYLGGERIEFEKTNRAPR